MNRIETIRKLVDEQYSLNGPSYGLAVKISSPGRKSYTIASREDITENIRNKIETSFEVIKDFFRYVFGLETNSDLIARIIEESRYNNLSRLIEKSDNVKDVDQLVLLFPQYSQNEIKEILGNVRTVNEMFSKKIYSRGSQVLTVVSQKNKEKKESKFQDLSTKILAISLVESELDWKKLIIWLKDEDRKEVEEFMQASDGAFNRKMDELFASKEVKNMRMEFVSTELYKNEINKRDEFKNADKVFAECEKWKKENGSMQPIEQILTKEVEIEEAVPRYKLDVRSGGVFHDGYEIKKVKKMQLVWDEVLPETAETLEEKRQQNRKLVNDKWEFRFAPTTLAEDPIL